MRMTPNSQRADGVFTLQSIKSRIETTFLGKKASTFSKFLLYSPLNQGLKHGEMHRSMVVSATFLLYSPLNQGLKL